MSQQIDTFVKEVNAYWRYYLQPVKVKSRKTDSYHAVPNYYHRWREFSGYFLVIISKCGRLYWSTISNNNIIIIIIIILQFNKINYTEIINSAEIVTYE